MVVKIFSGEMPFGVPHLGAMLVAKHISREEKVVQAPNFYIINRFG
jgi:hypothetical protein